jgi:hypothetical protein
MSVIVYFFSLTRFFLQIINDAVEEEKNILWAFVCVNV